jgi:hypothetical protein
MKADGRQRTPVLATAGHAVCCTMADSIRTLQHSLNSRPSLRHFEAKVTQAIVEPEMCFQKGTLLVSVPQDLGAILRAAYLP